MISIQARNANVKLFISVSKFILTHLYIIHGRQRNFQNSFLDWLGIFHSKTNSSTDYIKNTSLI